RHVLARRPRHDGTRPVRVRPVRGAQPGKGVPDAASLRRPAGAAPAASRRGRRRDLAAMTPPPTRPAEPDDAVRGLSRAAVVEPGSVEEAAESLAASARDQRSVLIAGGGTDLEIGPPPERLDVLLRTRRLDRIVEHAPSDQIAVVEAGVTLAALARTLAP